MPGLTEKEIRAGKAANENIRIFSFIKAIDNFLMEGKIDWAIALSGELSRIIDEVDAQFGGACNC